jgi:uncharacterized protein (DUF58 family)
MKVFIAPKLPAYVVLAAIGFIVGLVLRRPEPVLLGAPFLVALVTGLALARVPEVRTGFALDRERVVEGEEVALHVAVHSTEPVARLEVVLPLPDGLEPESGRDVYAFALAPNVPYQFDRVLRCRRWGGYAVGYLLVRARDPFGFLVTEVAFDHRQPLRVYPRPPAVRGIVQAAETQVFAGNERSRAKGDGIEFIDVRPFAPGDRVRRVNWRLSTRRRELYVNEFHREQNTDIILFLDTFVDVRGREDGTHDQAVRVAAALAERYLERRDRVGLVGFGGVLRWLRPGMGATQRYRFVESLIDTEVVVSFAWKDITVIPTGTLPPKALIVAITPLLDERSINALFDLRARRFDLAIVEVSPLTFVPPPADEGADVGLRIWKMEREALRDRFRRLGVPVGVWDGRQPLDGVIQEVQAFRRYARRARA